MGQKKVSRSGNGHTRQKKEGPGVQGMRRAGPWEKDKSKERMIH
jgi:hypothetical protein